MKDENIRHKNTQRVHSPQQNDYNHSIYNVKLGVSTGKVDHVLVQTVRMRKGVRMAERKEGQPGQKWNHRKGTSKQGYNSNFSDKCWSENGSIS